METILRSFEDSSTGSLGLGAKDMPINDDTNAALDGLTIAHDLLEHVNGVEHIGSIDDELEALGAIWYVRGQFNDIRRDGYGSRFTPNEAMAGDVVRMFRDHIDGDAYVSPSVPRTMPCEADIEFEEVMRIARDSYRGELNDPHADNIGERWAYYRAVCLARMRIGYRKAHRKYKSARRANDLFWKVAGAVDRYARHVECEGMEYRLTYGFRSNGDAYAYCEEAYDLDEVA